MLSEKLKKVISTQNQEKLSLIKNEKVLSYITEAVELCNPDEVFICNDSKEDLSHIREMAIKTGEEHKLKTEGHTYHFDGPKDQGRDRKNTKFLVPEGETLGQNINQIERNQGLEEIQKILKNSMNGKTLIVRLLTLGPQNSVFEIPCMECTDSWYVAHTVSLLYRAGYNSFTKLTDNKEFFYTLHSSGKLNENMVSTEIEKRRIYIDYTKNVVYSVNTQYAGNSVGFKKLALRLAIRKAHRECWLAEHFMVMGVKLKDNKIYIAGAFPSGCGKTSTAMLPGETILGDDIAYVRNIGGAAKAVNVESGIFGIIQNVNPEDDPQIYKILTSPEEIIFSNILVKDGEPYWIGMGKALPKEGINYSGKWHEGKTDENGNKILPSHKNARYAVRLSVLENCDKELDNPDGVKLGGIIFGGRDYRGYVPVQEGFDWTHGITSYGAALESETTFAVEGEEGKYEINIMSIQDFISIPYGEYLKNYIKFGKTLTKAPKVFGVNYFLKSLKTGEFLNGKLDKHIWIKWIAGRIKGLYDGIIIPTGIIPKYEDLKKLFKDILNKNYLEEDYIQQFTLRINENLAKIKRVREFYKTKVKDTPQEIFEVLENQEKKLIEAKEKYGDYISPEKFC